MDHCSWVVGKIDETAAMDGAHARSSVRDLVDALLALEGRGSTATVFGMSRGALAVRDDERTKLIGLIRAALVAKRDAFAQAGDTELLLELSEVAEACELPELRFERPPIPRVQHPDAPWLRDALAGIVVLRNTSDQGTDAVVSWFTQNYKGPDFGGIDLVEPNATGDGGATLLVGRWTDCLDDDVQEAVVAFLKTLEQSVSAVNEGITITRAGSEVRLKITSPKAKQIEIVPWHVYYGQVGLPSGPLDATEIRRLMLDVFPKLPFWMGVDMGAPHWLGHGVNESDGHIHQVSPYVRLDFLADGRVELTALAAEPEFTLWLRRFLEAMLDAQFPNEDGAVDPSALTANQ